MYMLDVINKLICLINQILVLYSQHWTQHQMIFKLNIFFFFFCCLNVFSISNIYKSTLLYQEN